MKYRGNIVEDNSYHWKDLQKFLFGLEPDMQTEFFLLAEIIKYQVFELCVGKDEGSIGNFYIPYMMNDAIECYLILENAEMTGEYLANLEEEIQAQLIVEENRYVLIIHQGNKNVFTLWFQNIHQVRKCYQYHQIGHFWVKGQEQWRRLVYIVGTIYDKYEYLGAEVCNEKEMELLPLMEFAPFRYWSPLRESLDDKYPFTYEGIDCMEKIAIEAGDRNYQKLLKIYRKVPIRWIENLLSRRLKHPKREKMYQLITKKVEQASQSYPKRDYGPKMNRWIQRKRQAVDQKLKAKGFQGTYPMYHKGSTTIQAVEEHPFTILESDDFQFQIQLMISECRHETSEKNSGFFEGKGRKGWIHKIG